MRGSHHARPRLASSLAVTLAMAVSAGTVHAEKQWFEIEKALLPGAAAGDTFGADMAGSGSVCIVAAPGRDGARGAAVAFQRSATGQLTYESILAPATAMPGEEAGWAVASAGDFAFLGAPYRDGAAGADQGAVYVFKRGANGQWVEQPLILPGDPGAGGRFGSRLKAQGDLLVVGSANLTVGGFANSGAAYLFRRQPSGAWIQEAKLQAPTPNANQVFGASVAVGTDLVVVGAPGITGGSYLPGGAAFVYRKTGPATWTLEKTLQSQANAADDLFGYSVGLQGDVALIGAPLDDVGSVPDRGSVTPFRRIAPGQWVEEGKIGTGGFSDFTYFGIALDMDGSRVAVHGVRGYQGPVATLLGSRQSDGQYRAEGYFSSDASGFGAIARLVAGSAYLPRPDDLVNGQVSAGSVRVLAACDECWGEYRRLADSPDFGGLTVWKDFYLEDVEDSTIQAVVNAPGLAVQNAMVPASDRDSVDLDDAKLDGFGSNGRSLRQQYLSDPPTMTFTFNSAALGGLPTTVGFVWTDGAAGSALFVEATGPGEGSVLRSVGLLGDSAGNGQTAEDRYISISRAQGIDKVVVRGASMFEIDHIQYDAPVPNVGWLRDHVNADANGDLAWHNPATGAAAVWHMSGIVRIGGGPLAVPTPLSYRSRGFGDFNGDGSADVLWQDTATGVFWLWLMDGQVPIQQAALFDGFGWASTWVVLAVADINGDRRADIVFRRQSDGAVLAYTMNGTQVLDSAWLLNAWSLEFLGSGDLNGDGRHDLLWRSAGGTVSGWLLSGTWVTLAAPIGNTNPVGPEWKAATVCDLDADGLADVVWRHTGNGTVNGWLMSGLHRVSGGPIGAIGPTWTLRGSSDLNGDDHSDLVWTNATTGQVNAWTMDGLVKTQGGTIQLLPPGWTLLNR